MRSLMHNTNVVLHIICNCSSNQEAAEDTEDGTGEKQRYHQTPLSWPRTPT